MKTCDVPGCDADAVQRIEGKHRCENHLDLSFVTDTDEQELRSACRGMIEIVEGLRGAMEHGTWRDERGQRLKDSPEWVRFYVAWKGQE